MRTIIALLLLAMAGCRTAPAVSIYAEHDEKTHTAKYGAVLRLQ
jgi:hypothetical protein